MFRRTNVHADVGGCWLGTVVKYSLCVLSSKGYTQESEQGRAQDAQP